MFRSLRSARTDHLPVTPRRRRPVAAASTGMLLMTTALALLPAVPAAAAGAAAAASTFAELQADFDSPGGGTVVLAADVSATGTPLRLRSGAPVTLDLHGHLLSITDPGDDNAAIDVGPGRSLTITDLDDPAARGHLTADGGTAAAGIGSSAVVTVVNGLPNTQAPTPGAITINGGEVTATGGAAGIGGGLGAGAGVITISGGVVNATGGGGAGIGAGDLGGGGTIALSGGSVTARGYPGIGGTSGGTVTISGAAVDAAGGGTEAAGIGGSEFGAAGAAVRITGGSVTATGGSLAAGIGGGIGGAGGTIAISGGSVTAAGGTGIGAGNAGPGGTLTVSGGSVTATSTADGTGIAVSHTSGALTILAGAAVTAAASTGDSAIRGFGTVENAGTLTIPAGSQLNVPSGSTLDNEGALIVDGSLDGQELGGGGGTVDNTGAILLGSTGSVVDDGQGPAGSDLLVSVHNYTLAFPGTPAPALHVYAAELNGTGLHLPTSPGILPTGTTFVGWFTDPVRGTRATDTTDLDPFAGPGPATLDLYAQTVRSQRIAFPSPSDIVYGASNVALVATASSGLPVSYTSTDPTICTIVGGKTVHAVRVGSCIVTAQQAGDTDFDAATPVSRTFSITPAPLTVTAVDLTRPEGQPNPSLAWTMTGFVDGDTPTSVSGTPALTTTATPTSAPGVYPITISTGSLSDANYLFTYVAGTLTVDPTSTTSQGSPATTAISSIEVGSTTPAGTTPADTTTTGTTTTRAITTSPTTPSATMSTTAPTTSSAADNVASTSRSTPSSPIVATSEVSVSTVELAETGIDLATPAAFALTLLATGALLLMAMRYRHRRNR